MPSQSIIATKIDKIMAPVHAETPAKADKVVDAKADVLNAAANAVEKAGDRASKIAKSDPEGAKAIMNAAKEAATVTAKSMLKEEWKILCRNWDIYLKQKHKFMNLK